MADHTTYRTWQCSGFLYDNSRKPFILFYVSLYLLKNLCRVQTTGVGIADIQQTRTEDDKVQDEDQGQHTPQDIMQYTLSTDRSYLIRYIIQQAKLRSLKLICRQCASGRRSVVERCAGVVLRICAE